MKEQLISFEMAKLAKEKGFFITDCSMYNSKGKVATKASDYIFGETYCRVTQSLLQKWLREKHNIHLALKPVFGKKHYKKFRVNLYFNEKRIEVFKYNFPDRPYFESYEEALEKGLQEALKLI